MSVLLVQKLSEAATLPVRGSELAAGYDLASAVEVTVPAGGKALVKTNLAIATPLDCYARIAPRSGLAWKKFIDVGAGVVDADYRGDVGVILFNFGDEDFVVNPGDRVAQLILEKVHMAPVEEVEELPDTNRGAGGFGSTGVTNALQENSNSTNTLPDAAAPAAKRACLDAAAPPPVPDAPALLPAAQLLLFLSDLEVAGALDAETKKSLKAFALSTDERMVACMQVYQTNGVAAEAAETLSVLLAA
eukprot:CAMPEP_0119467264 /NCGR_PEP_ID=MMETSP1344-20130328/1533_1 /TAXON_ID=236787 /ORGANISM="Florenciella parvula, Strain CCMP2471" /LENGTH=246 /DNA_ID=CAMNT_0007499621 /DNA_START=147 /DNA_END=887 /DNA_ORIENTATION=+